MWSIVLATLACDRGVDEGPCERVVLDDEGFFERPFPHDDRLVEGRASYEGYPSREFPLVDQVASIAERSAGWSPYGTIYVPFDRSLPDDVRVGLRDSVAPDSPVQLVDPDGVALPVHVRVFDRRTSVLPAHTLAVRPAWGRGMRPGTRYELRLSAEVGCADEGTAGVTVPITVAPVTDLFDGMIEVARDEVPDGAAFGDAWEEVPPLIAGSRLHLGQVSIPRWQTGEVPYATEGGDFRFGADGRPIVDGYDDVDVAFVQPPGASPPEGWPVVVILDGTGSSHLSAAYYGGMLAERGIAAVGIDLPLHGRRGVGPEFEDSIVNLGNLLSSFTGLLQGAADQVWLVDLLARDGTVVDLPDGPVPLDGTRLGYLGHSQGGIHGALAAAELDGKVAAVVLSGTGGGTFQGALLNQGSGIDLAAVVASLFGFVEGEELDDFHPLASLIQHAADPADPIHFAPHWQATPGLQDAPLPGLLVTMGTEDSSTPALATQAMAHAGRIPVVQGDYRIPADRVFPPPVDSLPVTGNAVAFDGSAVTAGLVQYAGGDHFAGIQDVERWRGFFERALLDDDPTLR